MAASDSVNDVAGWLDDRLAEASPDLLRAMIKQFAEALMAAEADTVCGAGYRERSDGRVNSRNGYRARDWDTRAGTVELAIPKLRTGSYFPEWLLERRRRAEQALVSVVATSYLLGVSTRRVEKPVGQPKAIKMIVSSWRPDLLAVTGVGPIVAATVLAAWSHSGRCRDDAAFAMLAGTAPIPASSGKTVRHRLNRSGDRQLNRAIYTVVITRLRLDPATRAYAERRRAQGKTDREIRRCLGRYVTRQLYRQLETGPPVALDAT